ncbi:MAG: hypothetical protein WCX30_03825 [Candidatus Paceibacterota bacterium]|jgi:hypothetical protein|nr:hypothetical protein [bacterium]
MKNLKEELNFCLKLWREQGYCSFGGKTNCSECATPYLLYKLIAGEILHGENMKRLTLDEWEGLSKTINKE